MSGEWASVPLNPEPNPAEGGPAERRSPKEDWEGGAVEVLESGSHDGRRGEAQTYRLG